MINHEELEWAFNKLEHIGQSLKITSIVLLTVSLMHVSIVFAVFSRILYFSGSLINLISIITTLVIFFLALRFDTLRKDGKSYYDEISGAMHGSPREIPDEMEIDSIRARVSIRKFMNSYEIPLIPGQFGPGVLVLINIMVLVMSVVFQSMGLSV